MQKNNKPEPMLCERCGIHIYTVEVRDSFFYCDECAKIWDRAEAVKDVDNDQRSTYVDKFRSS